MTDIWEAKRKTAINKVWKEFRIFILRRDGYRCVICKRGKDDGVVLQGGHIFPGHHDSTMFSELAVNCQCQNCNNAHNENPHPYRNWFKGKYGQKAFDELKIKHKRNQALTRGELVELYEHYKNANKEYELVGMLTRGEHFE